MTVFRYSKPEEFPKLDTPHWVVEASAGTGKTFTLEHLVVDLVLEAKLPLEQVLVVTFTEAAALELRRRIREKLQELRDLAKEKVREGAVYWVIDDGARERLDAALQAFDRTVISTIHAFCQKVLQESAFEAGRPFRQVRAAADDLFADVFQEHLRTTCCATPEDQAFLEEALRWAGSAGELEARLREAWKAGATLVPGPEQLDRARQAVDGFPLEALESPDALEKAYGKGPFGTARKRFEKLRECLNALRTAGRLDDWQGLRSLDLFKDPPEAVWAQKVWAGDHPEGPARRIREGLAALREAMPSAQALVVHRLLPPLADAIRQRKAAEGLFDFDDLIEQVAEGVRNPALVARLRERWQAALIDEFQDTDARQWEIFRTVFQTPEHRLVLVGDPKQAIYDFRGGDLPTYREATEALRQGGGSGLVLGRNHRSSVALVDAVNRVLEPAGQFFQAPNAYPEPVRAARAVKLADPAGELPPFRLFEVEATGGVGRLRARVASGIASAFRALLDSGATFDAGKEDEPPRPLHAGDLMVLTHTARESQQMARALQEAGLPTTFFKAGGLFQTREALELRDVLRGLLRPEDPDARGRALLTRFFGFSLAEAEACLDLPSGHLVRARLERWQELARQRRYPRLFNALLEESGLVPRLLITETGDRALTNTRHLLEHLLAEAAAAHLDPDDLLLRLGRWIEGKDLPSAETEAEPGLQRAEGEVRAVRLLTTHKAKGLEAPVVALFGGYSEGQGAKAALQRFHDGSNARCAYLGTRKDAPEPCRTAIQREAAREDERLLYVAMTRPKAQLVLPVFLPGTEPPDSRGSFDPDGHPKGRHGVLNRRLRALREADPVAWSAWAKPLPPPVEETSAASRPLPDRLDPLPAAPLPDFPSLARRGRPLQLLSFTSLARAFGEGRAASREEEARADEVELPRPARVPGSLPGGAATGSALHELLERLPPGSALQGSAEGWREANLGLAEACLAGQGLDRSFAGEALRLARLALTTPVTLPHGATLPLDAVAKRVAELPFQMPFPGHPDGLEGSLDLLFEYDGRIHFLDWKTNTLEGGDYGPEAVGRAVAAHYDLQVRIYTLVALGCAGIADEADYEARFGGAVYVFLRGLPEGGVWSRRPSWAEVQGWRAELAALPVEELALRRMAWGMHG